MMEVILLDKIHKLGGVGDQVSVKAGYGRNYLLPYGKAVLATPDNVAKFEAKRAELEKIAAEAKAKAQVRADVISSATVTISARVSEEGRLYGSVGTAEIAQAITKAVGTEVAKSEVQLPEGPFHEIGEFEVMLQLHSDITVPIKIRVTEEVVGNTEEKGESE